VLIPVRRLTSVIPRPASSRRPTLRTAVAHAIDMPSISVTPAWETAFPEAHVGVLVMEHVNNGPPSAALHQHARDIEANLLSRYAGADRAVLNNVPTAVVYQRHYRAFGQTYHVLRQLESVVLKSKPIESPRALVLAMFATELDTLLLTAGHDADALQPPLLIDRSAEGEHFVGLGGRVHAVREGDMVMRDASGIISAVIYGPDERTRLVDNTRRVLFTTYAPAGVCVAEITHHLSGLAEAVRLASPSATVQLHAVFPGRV
jgi:DNA/RNA-binding domain of Phe-tRNA-synthetase-like protein